MYRKYVYNIPRVHRTCTEYALDHWMILIHTHAVYMHKIMISEAEREGEEERGGGEGRRRRGEEEAVTVQINVMVMGLWCCNALVRLGKCELTTYH